MSLKMNFRLEIPVRRHEVYRIKKREGICLVWIGQMAAQPIHSDSFFFESEINQLSSQGFEGPGN